MKIKIENVVFWLWCILLVIPFSIVVILMWVSLLHPEFREFINNIMTK